MIDKLQRIPKRCFRSNESAAVSCISEWLEVCFEEFFIAARYPPAWFWDQCQITLTSSTLTGLWCLEKSCTVKNYHHGCFRVWPPWRILEMSRMSPVILMCVERDWLLCDKRNFPCRWLCYRVIITEVEFVCFKLYAYKRQNWQIYLTRDFTDLIQLSWR